jgi:hypothetical protein
MSIYLQNSTCGIKQMHIIMMRFSQHKYADIQSVVAIAYMNIHFSRGSGVDTEPQGIPSGHLFIDVKLTI